MLKTLHLKNCFTHHDRVIHFDTGLTCITGPNEAGKSLLLEMIAYCKFGKVALRGDADDYRTLYAALDFEVKGVPYRVVRDRSKAMLYRDGVELATGTKPVNAAVARILGYDYTVYCMANLCAQGQIEALGSMRPAERKKAVDQTIGLSVLDDISKWCGDQALVYNREAETIERFLVKPVEPAMPAGYQPSAVIQAEIDRLAGQDRERLEIEAWLRAEPVLPARPVPPCPEDAAMLQQQVDQRNTLAVQVAALKRQADAIPDAAFTLEQIEAAEAAWAAFHLSEEKRRALAGLVQELRTREECDEWLAKWDAYDRWTQRQRLAQHLSQCPACGHEWADGAAWEKVKDAPEVLKPMVSRAEVAEVLRRIDAWEASADLRAKYAAVVDAPAPATSEANLRKARTALAEAERKAALLAEMTALAQQFAKLPDRTADLAKRRQFEAEIGAWEQANARHDAWAAEKGQREIRLLALAAVPPALAQARLSWQAASVWEQQMAAYTTALETYQKQAQALAEARSKAQGWSNGKKAVLDLRGRVKGFLLPSLNKVASILLAQMTGGKRTSIVVDEDFDILVDGTAVNKLSGSGKAVANLALRVALGLVLTNRVFSVFMGDELDASMDADRAGFTAEALARLTETVGQVIVVSHKPFDADNNVDLGAMAA